MKLPPLPDAADWTAAGRPALWEWLVLFWERAASNQADAAERDRCEDEAWNAARRLAELRRLDLSRTLA